MIDYLEESTEGKCKTCKVYVQLNSVNSFVPSISRGEWGERKGFVFL